MGRCSCSLRARRHSMEEAQRDGTDGLSVCLDGRGGVDGRGGAARKGGGGGRSYDDGPAFVHQLRPRLLRARQVALTSRSGG